MNDDCHSAAGIPLRYSREELERKARESGIPGHMIGGVVRYVYDHLQPGDFLTAVIGNDLSEACGRADTENQTSMFTYVYFFYNYAPAMCWGSYDKLNQWLKLGRQARCQHEFVKDVTGESEVCALCELVK